MLDTFPETNSSHLKMAGWNTNFLSGWPIFRGKPLVLGSVGPKIHQTWGSFTMRPIFGGMKHET